MAKINHCLTYHILVTSSFSAAFVVPSRVRCIAVVGVLSWLSLFIFHYIFPDGEIFATQNLLLHEVQSYDIILSADDSFNTVSSPLLTITLTGMNNSFYYTISLPFMIQVGQLSVSGEGMRTRTN